MAYKRTSVGIGCFLCLAASVAATALASEEVEHEVARDCINTRLIKSTQVLDDQNIVFKMTGSTLYRNFLPKPCRGLARNRRFIYGDSSFRRLCQSDRIRVIVDSGFGLQEGRSCKIGSFFPVTEQDVAAYIRQSTGGPGQEKLELPDPDSIEATPDGMP